MSVTKFAARRPILSGLSAALFALTLAACGGASSETGSEAKTVDAGEKTGDGALSDMAIGSPDAPITVIEFASVTCPHCATYHESVFPAIKEKYIDTGKVRFIFREFPTPPANLSIAGAMIARCSADKGGSTAYFTILSSLFNTQRTWIYGDSPREELLKIAAQTGMSETEFDECVKRQELLDFLNENIKEASDKFEITSTPSFVVNGQTRHFSTVEDTSKAFDELLAKLEAADGKAGE